MLTAIVVLMWSAAMFALYRHLVTMRDGGTLWRRSVAIGLSVGLLRGGLASAGWYGVEHTGGPLQIPAFALAMLAWPEAALFARHRGPTQLSVYPLLALALTLSTVLLVAGVALAAQATRRRRDP